MRLVVDTNQADEVRKLSASADSHPTIVIPSMIWAEILSGRQDFALNRIRAIAQYDVLFGKEVDVIYEQLRNLTESEIAEFDCVYEKGTFAHQSLLSQLYDPEAQFVQVSKAAAAVSNWSTVIESRIAKYKRDQQGRKSKGESILPVRWNDIADAHRELFAESTGAIRRQFVADVTEVGARPLKAKTADTFFDAVLANGQLRRFLYMYATVVFGYFDCWKNASVNNGVARNRNDVSDVLLALCPRDGDVVLSADTKLRHAFRHADPKERVAISTWKDWINR